MYYFDYASTTKPSTKNIELYAKLLADVFEHPDPNNKAGRLVAEAQKMILQSLNLNNSYEVIFTSGGTEANNLAVIGFAQNFTSPKHFITSEYEHSSLNSSFKHLQTMGHEVTYLKTTADGQIDYNQLADSIRNNTVMVSIMAVNNELGSINDESRIRNIIDSTNPQIIYFGDCVQAVGKVNYDYQKLDMLTVSGHKLYAPKGSGAVIYKKNINLINTIYGGEQQAGIRPGTLCPCNSAVLGYGIKTEQMQLADTISYCSQLIDEFLKFVHNHPKMKVNVLPMAPTVSVCFKTQALSESLVAVLAGFDIYTSTRSACSKKLNVPSRSLTSIGLSANEIDRTIRFSFSHQTTKSELQYLMKKLEEILKVY